MARYPTSGSVDFCDHCLSWLNDLDERLEMRLEDRGEVVPIKIYQSLSTIGTTCEGIACAVALWLDGRSND